MVSGKCTYNIKIEKKKKSHYVSPSRENVRCCNSGAVEHFIQNAQKIMREFRKSINVKVRNTLKKGHAVA
jgi:hypothetical protein